jgi:UDP-N-acetylglucosamine--dolichyl-phosphate N-acetylglucosaminephosphotransferase
MQNILFNQFVPLFALVFTISWMLTPTWIKIARRAELSGRDIHKTSDKKVAEMGGIVVIFGFIVGVMGYIGMRVFLFNAQTNVLEILAILSAILISSVIGILDDVLGWKIGLKQWQKPILTSLVALPIMAINGGVNSMSIPFVGMVDFGMLYPLIFIPVAIIIASNAFNMLAGFNGLEAGMGVIIIGALSYLSYVGGEQYLAVIGLVMVFALLGFLMFNKYPAKVFGGDTLTYSVGAFCAILAILGNQERALVILFIPYAAQFFLKLRGRFKKESFAKLKNDGTLEPRYDKFYGLENLMVYVLSKLGFRVSERKTVYGLYLVQIIFVIIVLVI